MIVLICLAVIVLICLAVIVLICLAVISLISLVVIVNTLLDTCVLNHDKSEGLRFQNDLRVRGRGWSQVREFVVTHLQEVTVQLDFPVNYSINP